MMPREEYYLKEELRRQKRQLEYLERELKNPAGIKEGALTDREKLILHFCCMQTLAKVNGTYDSPGLMENMVEEVWKYRCHSLSHDDVANLLEQVNDEMIAGQIMMKDLIEQHEWSTTGERPNRNTDWSDMK
jgi:hypothetical protein